MLEELKNAQRIVGAKQVIRAVEGGGVRRVFIASDADVFVTRPVYDACRSAGVEVTEVPSMKALGEACSLKVGAAAAAVRR